MRLLDHEHARPITTSVLVRWATFAGTVGFTQLFRSDVEVFLGAGFLAGAVLLVSVRVVFWRRPASWPVAFAGFGTVGTFCLARALSAPFVGGATWHGAAIVLAAWSMFAYAAAQFSVSIFNEMRDDR